MKQKLPIPLTDGKTLPVFGGTVLHILQTEEVCKYSTKDTYVEIIRFFALLGKILLWLDDACTGHTEMQPRILKFCSGRVADMFMDSL